MILIRSWWHTFSVIWCAESRDCVPPHFSATVKIQALEVAPFPERSPPPFGVGSDSGWVAPFPERSPPPLGVGSDSGWVAPFPERSPPPLGVGEGESFS